MTCHSTAQHSLKATLGMQCLPRLAVSWVTGSWICNGLLVKISAAYWPPLPAFNTCAMIWDWRFLQVLWAFLSPPTLWTVTSETSLHFLGVSDFTPLSLSVCQVMQKIWLWMRTELLSLIPIYVKVWVTDDRNTEAQADTNDNWGTYMRVHTTSCYGRETGWR